MHASVIAWFRSSFSDEGNLQPDRRRGILRAVPSPSCVAAVGVPFLSPWVTVPRPSSSITRSSAMSLDDEVQAVAQFHETTALVTLLFAPVVTLSIHFEDTTERHRCTVRNHSLARHALMSPSRCVGLPSHCAPLPTTTRSYSRRGKKSLRLHLVLHSGGTAASAPIHRLSDDRESGGQETTGARYPSSQ